MQFKVDKHTVFPTKINGIKQGIKQSFIDSYEMNMSMNTENDVTGFISVGNTRKLTCDIEVIIVLKTLVKMGSCKSEALALACRQLFKTIIKSDPSYVSKATMLRSLGKGNYETAQLCAAIEYVVKG